MKSGYFSLLSIVSLDYSHKMIKHLTFPEYAQATKNWIVVVDFYAQRCPPCKMIAPHLESLAESASWRATFYKVDTDEQTYLAGLEWITAMPTMKVYKDWEIVKVIIWADLQKLHETLVTLLQ